jgi:hypothetical protein
MTFSFGQSQHERIDVEVLTLARPVCRECLSLLVFLPVAPRLHSCGATARQAALEHHADEEAIWHF